MKKRRPKSMANSTTDAATLKEGKAKGKKTKPVPVEVVAEPPKLPSTGAEPWLQCLGGKKVTVGQLADASLKKLNLDDSTRRVIATRADAWVYIEAKKGVGTRDGSKLLKLVPPKVEAAAPDVYAIAPVEPTDDVEFSPVAWVGDAV